MNAPGPLPFEHANEAIRIAHAQDVGGKGIEPSLCLAWAQDMIGEGERKEAEPFEAVTLRESLDIPRERTSGLLPLRA